jgi:hypothetical protein
MFRESHNREICALLRKCLLDESESDYVRERSYFAIGLVKDLVPFPEEKIGQWNEMFDAFRFPQDVKWEWIDDEGEVG